MAPFCFLIIDQTFTHMGIEELPERWKRVVSNEGKITEERRMNVFITKLKK